jgi:hypothetical protein
MSPEQRAKLFRLLLKLEAEDLAVKLGRVTDARELPVTVRGEMAEVLGHEAAPHGYDRFGRPDRYGDELDALVEALAWSPGLHRLAIELTRATSWRAHAPPLTYDSPVRTLHRKRGTGRAHGGTARRLRAGSTDPMQPLRVSM